MKKYFEYFAEKLLVPLAIVAGTYFVTSTVENVPKTAVIIGVTKYSIAPPDSQELQLKSVITDRANKLLGNINKKYEFIPTVLAGSYGDLVKGLLNDRVDIAFLAPYLYTQGVMDKNAAVYSHFRLVGFKYTSSGEWYYSGIVIPKTWHISTLQQFKDTFTNPAVDKRPIFIFGKDPSASTMAIPQLYLAQNNIPFDTAKKMGREDMIKKLGTKPDSNFCYIGFLSSEDWEEAKKDKRASVDSFEFLRIDMPIPDDPVFVNKDKWDERFNKKGLCFWKQTDGELILKSLRYWVYTDINRNGGLDNEWIENNREFIKLIYSGTITKIQNDSLTIRFINDAHHTEILKRLDSRLNLTIGHFDKKTDQNAEIEFKYPRYFQKENADSASVIVELDTITNTITVRMDTIKLLERYFNKSVIVSGLK